MRHLRIFIFVPMLPFLLLGFLAAFVVRATVVGYELFDDAARSI
jgi:hypothetical protein